MKFQAVVPWLLALAFPLRLLADDGAMNNGEGGVELLDLSKGQQSQVRMVKEHLKFKYGKDYTRVSAVFYFKNMSSQAVTQLTGFPDDGLAEDKDKIDRHTGMPLEEMKTFVDGKRVPSKIVYGYYEKTKEGYWVPAKKGDMVIAWHTAELTFPPNAERVLERRYKAGNGISYNNYNSFVYVLITGATWKDTIGEMTADVELKDGLTVKDLYWPCFDEEKRMRSTMEPAKDEWTILEKTHLRLVWRDFKPSLEKDKQVIQIANPVREEGMVLGQGEWPVTKSDKFVDCDGHTLLYNADEKSFILSEMAIDNGAVSQMTGGLPLKDYLKPGDILEYDGDFMNRDTSWIRDLKKNKVVLIRKNKQGAPVTIHW